MASTFSEAAEDIRCADSDNYYAAFRKEHYFFYGSLMDLSTLVHVLKLRDRPELLPAMITGYTCILWGQYPALVDGPPEASVRGMAYVVQRPSHQKLLELYETDHYKVRHCLINLQDGKEVKGRTFLWNADRGLLKEGTFDLKDRQMNKLGW
jgi:gamma-glutamylcyclotransferase (GGCT)/AIG2-like uncharacterized protein YtfP